MGDDTCQLHLGDCLTIMATLPSGSVDLILADLPYGTTAHAWDSLIPLPDLWRQYRRLIRPRGSVVLTASQPFTSTLITSNLPWFKYTWVWEKDNGTNFFNVKHQPFKTHEDVVVFSPSASSYSPKGSMVYHPQMAIGKPYKAQGHQGGLHHYHQNPTGKKVDNDGTRYPRSVIRFNCERGLHPTQKPVPLMEYLIRTYSNEGDMVLDNCMGSGTTGVACRNTGRRFIGIERDGGYFDTAMKRLVG